MTAKIVLEMFNKCSVNEQQDHCSCLFLFYPVLMLFILMQ